MRRPRRSVGAVLAVALTVGLLGNCSDDEPRRISAEPGKIATIEEDVGIRGASALRVGPDDAIYIAGQAGVVRYPRQSESETVYRASRDTNDIASIAFGRGLVFLTERDDGTVRAIDSHGGIVNLAGNGLFGRPSDGALAAHSPLLCPSGLAYNTRLDALLIRDGAEVRTVDSKGVVNTPVHQELISDSDSCGLFGSVAIATDPDGAIYNAGPTYVVKVQGSEHQSYPPDIHKEPPAFDGVVDWVYDRRSKSVFVADKFRVRRIAADGTISVVAGNGEDKISGDGGRALDAGLGKLAALDVDSKGNLYLLSRSSSPEYAPPSLRVVGGPIERNAK